MNLDQRRWPSHVRQVMPERARPAWDKQHCLYHRTIILYYIMLMLMQGSMLLCSTH
jgi:hypothetical protein